MIDLSAWPGLAVVRRLDGGHRNEVFEVAGRQRAVARRSGRSPQALNWELDLLDFLAENGFLVPGVVPTGDGRRTAAGVVVQTWLTGRAPAGAGDWALVAAELARLHRLTRGWPQRPGFASTAELLSAERGGDVDLTAMPAAAAAACRSAWRVLPPTSPAVVHGDPGAPNVRINGGRVGLLDWDEARVDHPDLDLADLPHSPLTGDRLRRARAAVNAWEAANGWRIEPDYAKARLERLRTPCGQSAGGVDAGADRR